MTLVNFLAFSISKHRHRLPRLLEADFFMPPLINILIRTHRPKMLIDCIESVMNCGYENIQQHIINGTGYGEGYKYNLLCNTLKSQVTDGYFFFLDDDDLLIPGALSKIELYLRNDRPIICQMLRNGKPKPVRDIIKRGKIGMPCMIMHHSLASLADIPATVCGDYEWIKSVTDKVGYKFVPIPLVNSLKRSYGK